MTVSALALSIACNARIHSNAELALPLEERSKSAMKCLGGKSISDEASLSERRNRRRPASDGGLLLSAPVIRESREVASSAVAVIDVIPRLVRKIQQTYFKALRLVYLYSSKRRQEVKLQIWFIFLRIDEF